MTLDHRIAVVRAHRGLCGLLCESVEGLFSVAEQAWTGLVVPAPGAGLLAAGAVAGEPVVVLYDLDRSLSPEEEIGLEAALERHRRDALQ